MTEDMINGETLKGVLLGVMGIFQDVIIAFYFLRIRDEGDVGVIHDEFIIFEDVADNAYQFATLLIEAGVELLVYLRQLQQLGELVLVAQQVEASEAGQFAVVKIDYFAGKLSLYFFQDKLSIHKLVGEQFYFSLVVPVGDILVQLAIDDDLLGKEDMLQLVHANPFVVLVYFKETVLRTLY
jgi:hypothetical protein